MKSIDKFVLVLVASLALLLAGCGGGSSTAPVDPGPTEEELAAERAQMQTAAIMSASTALNTALGALSGSAPTQDQIDAVNTAISGLQAALTAAADVHDAAKTGYQAQVTSAQTTVMQAAAALMAMQDAAAEEARKAAEAAAAAMAVTATKLYAGIGATPLTGHAVTVDGTTGVWSVDPAAVGTVDLANQALEADEDTMVPDNHGWEGTRHTASGEGTYEAVIYSHPDDPTVTEGAAFNDSANGGYTLSTDAATMGELTTLDAASGGAGVGRVASPSFDQSAGEKTFELGDNMMRVVIAGSYHGVPGTYYCTPAASDACGATVADMGFTLGGGTWTFKPTNPAMKLMDTSADDADYASYGWWLHKSEDDETYTASAFAVYRGTAPTVNIAALRGSATYTGGAAGKYALRSSTGGTNDAGHFTADVTLEATFATVHSITGTVDNFTGGDGESRDWSVALGKSVVAGGGAIAGALAADGTADTTNTGPQMTTWTIGGVAGDAGGQWSGNLHEEGDDGVPAIATGTFSSTFGDSGNDARMVGAFGVNVDD